MAEIKYFKLGVTWEDKKELMIVHELEIYGHSFCFFFPEEKIYFSWN